MKIQRNTLILALAAFGLASGIYIQQRLTAPDSPGEIRTEGSAPLFDFDEADVTQFTIRRPGLTLSLEKREAEPTDGSTAESAAEPTGDAIADLEAETAAQADWALTGPEQIPASDGAVAFLLNLLATGDRRDSFTITGESQVSSSQTEPNQPSSPSPQRLAEFGFDQPMAQVDVTLADGTAHRLILGDSNFDDSGIYAVQDLSSSSGSIEIFLVDSSLEPALLRPLEEWRYTAELPDEAEPASDDAAMPSTDPASQGNESEASSPSNLEGSEPESDVLPE